MFDNMIVFLRRLLLYRNFHTAKKGKNINEQTNKNNHEQTTRPPPHPQKNQTIKQKDITDWVGTDITIYFMFFSEVEIHFVHVIVKL
jgi:hypothetical protein